MRIPLIYIPRTKLKKFLYIEKRYKSNKLIIPIGCDCHPAFMLQKLNIRINSYPFDWMNTDPIKGLEYVTENIKTQFNDFLKEVKKNERGYYVSSQYPYAEFFHEKELDKNRKDQKKLKRRSDRFLKSINNKCGFLYNITSEALNSKEKSEAFCESAIKFCQLLKKDQKLHIYIRYDENLNENKEFCIELKNNLKNVKKINIADYVREQNKEGIWGNEKKYPSLLKSMGLEIKITFPKIYFK